MIPPDSSRGIILHTLCSVSQNIYDWMAADRLGAKADGVFRSWKQERDPDTQCTFSAPMPSGLWLVRLERAAWEDRVLDCYLEIGHVTLT